MSGKYGFAFWSCIWPRCANSCLWTYCSPSEFNRLMSAAGRGLHMVTVSATWWQKGHQRLLEKGAQLVWRVCDLACKTEEGRGSGPRPILEVQRTESKETWPGNRRWQLSFVKHLLSSRHYAKSGYILSLGPSKSTTLQKGNCSHMEKTDHEQEHGTAQILKCPEGKAIGISCKQNSKTWLLYSHGNWDEEICI